MCRCRSSYISVPPDSLLYCSNIYTHTSLTRDHLYAITAQALAILTPLFSPRLWMWAIPVLPAPFWTSLSCRHVSAPVTPKTNSSSVSGYSFKSTGDSGHFIDSTKSWVHAEEITVDSYSPYQDGVSNKHPLVSNVFWLNFLLDSSAV